MYRERGYCKRCGKTIFREAWKRPILPEINWWEEPEFPPPPIEIEEFYKYFDEQGYQVVLCPGCWGRL